MAVVWHDVTIPLRDGMTAWPGDPPFSFSPVRRIADGASCNTSLVELCTHTGTHIDAPWHFEDEGKRLHEVDTTVYFGKALLLDIPHADLIGADDLGSDPLPERVLLKTRNSQHPVDAPFRADYVAIAPDAAWRLADEGVKLVGVDYLSVAPYKQKGQVTHHLLLRSEIVVVEGLRLGGFPGGAYWFTVLPVPIVGADGAPCRAFIGQEESSS